MPGEASRSSRVAPFTPRTPRSRKTSYAPVLINKAILTPKNVDVDAINLAAHLQCGGEDVEFLSRDKALEAEDNNTYPPEFLHSLKLPELPPHSLILKVGQPIMLMRNLNSAIGIANGTRLIITGLHKNVIVARGATAPSAVAFLPADRPHALRRGPALHALPPAVPDPPGVRHDQQQEPGPDPR